MVDIQSLTAEIRRGKKRKKERKKKPQGKNIMACPITQGGHNKINNMHTYNIVPIQHGPKHPHFFQEIM